MTVAELIEKLTKCSPNAIVTVYNHDDCVWGGAGLVIQKELSELILADEGAYKSEHRVHSTYVRIS